MEVYLVWNTVKKSFVGTNYYVSETPKVYHIKGAAQNKADQYFRYFGEICIVKTFELLEKED